MDESKKELCKRINHRIDVHGYCVVYDHELARIWPPQAALRQQRIQRIERFAAQNGLAVTIRDTGLNATFKKKAGPEQQKMSDVKNAGRPQTRLQTANEGCVP